MRRIFALFSLLFALTMFSCTASPSDKPDDLSSDSQSSSSAVTQQPPNMAIKTNRFYLNGGQFRIKSIGLEAFMPGENPGLGSYPVKLDYVYALSNIKALNANTVYLLTGDPANLQAAFFQQAKAKEIYIILGVWFSDVADDYSGHSGDFQNSYFKTFVKGQIKKFIDKFHNIGGENYSSQIIYITLGNEFQEWAINNTKTLHPGVTNYRGTYVSTAGVSHPVECFLAEMADYAKSYEASAYKQVHYITHHTWPVVSPKYLKNSFLDVISYNLYSYWPDFVTQHAGGSYTKTPYQGALEELASYYPDKPFVVSEYGISVAPDNVTTGTNLAGQASEISNRWTDITTAKYYISGGSVHELFDQWWKDDDVAPYPAGADENEHDATDREEWFGIIEVGGTASQYTFTPRPAYYQLKSIYGK